MYSVVGAFSRSMPAQPTHVNAVVEIRLGCGQDIKRHTACGEPLLKAPSNCERDRRDSRCAAATASFSSFDTKPGTPSSMISLCCAAQYYRREGADKQLRINGKVWHGHLTPVPRPKFHPRLILFPRSRRASATVQDQHGARAQTLTGVGGWSAENHPT